jgi:uncharacterized protein DUF1236
MRKTLLLASVAALSIAPALALADTIVVKPEVDTWVMKQKSEPGISIDANISIGGRLPDNVTVMDVPDYDAYSYVVVNKKRVLVEKKTHKVVKIYN